MDMNTIRQHARERMKGCKVCPQCNGKACAGMIPGFGGVRTGRSFQRNIEALQAYGLVMRSMAGTEEMDTTIPLFGQTLAMPILVAPIGAIALNTKLEGDPAAIELAYTEAVMEGARQAGTLAFTGDGGAPYMYDSGLQSCRRRPGTGIPTIKPRDDEAIIERARLAKEAGAVAVASDIDAATLINMRLLGQPVGPKSVASIARIAASIELPFIVKGIMSVDEAVACAAAGAKGIVVTNHGGRVLDGMAGTADVLPDIAKAVKGKVTIFVDGGVRSGEDVLKFLALGADAVLVGRPVAIAATGGGSEGVALYLQTLLQELKDAMMITGTTDVKQVDASILQRL